MLQLGGTTPSPPPWHFPLRAGRPRVPRRAAGGREPAAGGAPEPLPLPINNRSWRSTLHYFQQILSLVLVLGYALLAHGKE